MRALVVLLVLTGTARAQSRFAPRTVDFQGGVVYGQAPHPGWDAVPGARLALRGFLGEALWVAGRCGYEPSADLRDPERGELASVLATGAAMGVFADAHPAVTLFAGARGEWLHLFHRAGKDGFRGGPVASAALFVGDLFGHPMALEAEAGWSFQSLGAGTRDGVWHGALSLTGVLFPDRP